MSSSTRRSKRSPLVVVPIVVFATVALAMSHKVDKSSASVNESQVGADDSPFPWGNPLILGDVESLQTAQSSLTFQAVDPKLAADVGTLDHVVGTDSNVDGPHAIAWAYHDATGVPFFVEESPSRGLNDAVLESWASCAEDSNCPTAGKSMTTLADGTTAFVGVGAQDGGFAISVIWVRNGIKFTVAGPTDRFSLESALGVANMIPPAS